MFADSSKEMPEGWEMKFDRSQKVITNCQAKLTNVFWTALTHKNYTNKTRNFTTTFAELSVVMILLLMI